MISNEPRIKEIMSYFSWIESMVKINNDFAYTDINISIETFILDLLKIIDIGDYENCNIKKINYPCIDLIDSNSNIGLQITSQTNSKKIKETLDKNSNLKIKFFFLDSSYKPKQKTFQNYSNFSVDDDIINFEKIIKIIYDNDIKIDEILKFLKKNIVLPIDIAKIDTIFQGYSKYQQEIILKDISKVCKTFVPTSITSKCLEHLEEKNLLILIGNPGVGKSYNSKFLVAKYMEKGFKLLYSPNKNLKDMLEKYNNEDNFVLFIDDIFGSNNLDFMNTLSDSEIVSLLENSNKNLKIIINSRTSLFNDVNQKYDKIGRLGLKPFIIETSEFTYTEKARILIKHLKLSKIPQKYIYSLFEKDNYYIFGLPIGVTNRLNIYRIIYHKNYNPRIIEQITSLDIITGTDNYIESIINNLNNPHLIYDHPYNNNLDENERTIIKIIYLKSIYKKNYEVDIDQLSRITSKLGMTEEQFEISIRKLEKSFISLYNKLGKRVCKFYDPSVMDYCICKFKESSDMERLVNCIDTSEELDSILLNEKINFETKKKKIIDLNYSNFGILKKLESEIVSDDQMCNYIKDKLFNSNHYYTSDEDYFCDEQFISEMEVMNKLRKMDIFEKLISFSMSGINNHITKIILKNFNKFLPIQQNTIIDCCSIEIDNVLDSEIRDYIDSQETKDACDEELLRSEFVDCKDNIIAKLKLENVSGDLIHNIEINIKNFDIDDFISYIDDKFNEEDSQSVVDDDTMETINIVEEFYKSKINRVV